MIDGTRAPRFDADVGIAGGRIVALGDLSPRRARQEIDARGSIVAPGFIDSHTHDDQALLAQPDMSFKVSQGVTTVVAGNCGVSIAPLREGTALPPPLNLLDVRASGLVSAPSPRTSTSCRRTPAALNVAGTGGPHQPARQRDEQPRPRRQRRRDRRDARAARRSAGRRRDRPVHRHLFYPPAAPRRPRRSSRWARALTGRGGVYATHMRDEGDHVMESLDETLAHRARARRAGRDLAPQGDEPRQLRQVGADAAAHPPRDAATSASRSTAIPTPPARR